MYIWRYEVNPGDEEKFEQLYGPQGDWARFFSRSPSYVETDLLRSREGDCHITVDKWCSEEAHAAFVAENQAEFDELDDAGERLTRNERPIGKFDVVQGADAARD
jgi:heme-degrading monooxygenase HmoA